MFLALLGVGVAAAICAGPLAPLAAPATALSDRVVAAAADLAHQTLPKLPYAADNPKAVSLFAALLAVCMPGLVACTLTWGARMLDAARRTLSGVIVAAGLVTFLFLPPGKAAVLVVGAFAATAILLVPFTLISRIAAWAFATVIAFGHAEALWDGTAPAILDGIVALGDLSGIHRPDLWRFALMALGLAPFAAAAGAAFHPSHRS